MRRAVAYLAWAKEHLPRAELDLAASGVANAPLDELVAAPSLADLGGPARLHAAMARHLARPEDEIVPALGASHALALAFAAVTAPGDEVLVESPGYEPLARAAEIVGATTRTFARRREDRWALDGDAIAAALGPRTRAVVVSSPHNPTGARTSDEDLSALASLLRARGVTLVVDEVYRPFDDVAARGAGDSVRSLDRSVVAVSSLTKAYGLGHARVGWVSAPEPVASRARDAVLATVGLLGAPHGNLGAAVFDALPALARRSERFVVGKRALVQAWLDRHRELDCALPESGLFALVAAPPGVDVDAALERARVDHGVLAVPGRFFGAPACFRVAWTREPEVIERGLSVLAESMGLAGR